MLVRHKTIQWSLRSFTQYLLTHESMFLVKEEILKLSHNLTLFPSNHYYVSSRVVFHYFNDFGHHAITTCVS